MEDNKENNNTGCIIFFVIVAIGVFVFSITNISKESLAETGQLIMLIVSIAIVWGLMKLFSNKKSSTSENHVTRNDRNQEKPNESENKGCIKGGLIVIALIILLAIIFNTIGNNFELNLVIGILIFIILFIVLTVWLWNSFKK